MREGMTDLLDFYCCEDCFESYMDELYGKGNWRMVEDDLCDGYYETFYNGEWAGTGIFYTEWEDDDDTGDED